MKEIKLTNKMKGVIAIVFAAAIALFALSFSGALLRSPIIENIIVSDKVARHPFTGEWLSEEIESPRIYGVMVENHLDSWPQSGLDQASLVIEAPVEARIPRMLAFFSEEQEVEKIGPVRSARPYYINWNAGLDAVYAHVGGSPEALEILQVDSTIDINEFSNEWFFWRENGSRQAPHNVFTSIEELGEALERFESRFGEQDNEWERWSFKDDAEFKVVGGEPVPVVESVGIDFAGEPYVIEWKYDSDTNSYKRYQAGELHEMEDGSLIFADNVVVMETDVKILDSVGRRSVRTIGEGNALVFQDGQMSKGNWNKPSKSSRLEFFSEDNLIYMNAGKTWIEVIPSLEQDVSVEYGEGFEPGVKVE